MSFDLTLKELYRIHWYDVVFFLLGAILSFADPVTDILTLLAFYREDHKTWFGVGLAFVILPCLVFPFVHYFSTLSAAERNKNDPLTISFQPRAALKAFLWGLNPFSAALVRLRAFYLCMKYFRSLWSRSHDKKKTVPRPEKADKIESDGVLLYNKLAPFVEALLESAPQATIQLYAMNVQEEPVKIIQMISLPVSFLPLAWTFTTADGLLHDDEIGVLDVKNKLLLFVTHLFLLSSRLFAIVYFIVSYKWWIVNILLFHSTVIVLADIILLKLSQRKKVTTEIAIVALFLSLLNWVRDDLTLYQYFDEGHNDDNRKQGVRMQFLSNVLFPAENIVMISLFYFSQHSNAWYTLPVTICVCSLSYVGVLIRLVHFRFLRKAYVPLVLAEPQSLELISSPTFSSPTGTSIFDF